MTPYLPTNVEYIFTWPALRIRFVGCLKQNVITIFVYANFDNYQ